MSPILYSPFDSEEDTEMTEGLIASTTNALFADKELASPGSARVKVASFPAASRISPLLRDRDNALTYSKSVFKCPSSAMYWKDNIDDPEPLE